MRAIRTSLSTLFGAAWRGDRLLTITALAMLPPLAAFGLGLALDPRLVTGAPVWLKPAKFAVSIAVYCLTLAWATGYLTDWPRLRRLVTGSTAVVLVAELVIIAVQAGRGTASHFNVSTPLDRGLFSIMGAGIALQTLMAAAFVVALWRQRFADPVIGWGLRLGLLIAVLGASVGGAMVRPTAAQRAALASGPVTVVGAHTVGAEDGGRGVPGTGWSVEHGDLRVPHFVGLHAFQALPLVALFARRRWADAAAVRLVIASAASYAGLLGILFWQALRGQSLVRPDASTLTALAAWTVGTALVILFALPRHPAGRRAAAMRV